MPTPRPEVHEVNVGDLDASLVLRLLGDAVGGPPDRQAQRLRRLAAAGTTFAVFEGDVALASAIGHRVGAQWVMDAIDVDDASRGQGLGRALVDALARHAAPAALVAETDDDAVDFYRRTGFQVEATDSPWPGTNRYRCVRTADRR